MDLFENIDLLPNVAKKVCNKWLLLVSDDGFTYKNAELFKKELQGLGYTFDFELDAIPFNLRKITNNQELKN